MPSVGVSKEEGEKPFIEIHGPLDLISMIGGLKQKVEERQGGGREEAIHRDPWNSGPDLDDWWSIKGGMRGGGREEAIHRDPWTSGPDLDDWWRVTAGAGPNTFAGSAAVSKKEGVEA